MQLVTSLQCGITANKGPGGVRPETETRYFSEPSLAAEEPNRLLFHFFLICMFSPQDSASHGFQEYKASILRSARATQHKPDRLACACSGLYLKPFIHFSGGKGICTPQRNT